MRSFSFTALAALALALAAPAAGVAQTLSSAAGCGDVPAASEPAHAVACTERAVERAQSDLSRTYRSVWAETPSADRASFARRERAWLDGRYLEARRCAERESNAAPFPGGAEAAMNVCLARLMEDRRDALLASLPGVVVARKVAIGGAGAR